MKSRVVLAVLALMSTTHHVVAQSGPPLWFPVQMKCDYSPGQVTCLLVNTSAAPMFCMLQADGLFPLPAGGSLYAKVNGWINPGEYRYAYVYTSPPNPPFAGAVGGGQCRL